jgi:hypothetical protein
VSLPKPWRELDRSTIGAVPDRYGVYELGDQDGTSLGLETGPLQAELKEELSYGDAHQVRWLTAESPRHAERLLEKHE